MRIRVEFAKTEPMRYTSHLDLYRAWERLLRRTGVQMVFSQGYNPRPKLQLAAPLALGITSLVEIIDFWLSEDPGDLNQLESRLLAAQPPGIEIRTVEIIDPSAPPLQNKVSAAQYQVTLLDQVQDLDQKIDALLASESLPREKRGKTYDLRPLVQELSVEKSARDHLQMLLAARDGGTGRPEEVLLALDIQPENTRIERTHLVIQD
jgi:radical SAM-linked protein